MAYKRIMAMQILDIQRYSAYRDQMTPILAEYDGCFEYDFTISEVLKKCCDVEINRLFMITFPTRQQSVDFFTDPRYLEIRKTYFESSVGSVTQIAEFEER